MIATDKYIEVMAPLIVQLWPDNAKDEAIEIIEEYLYSEETGAFVYFVDNQCVGLALCSLRHDYVEGCKSSPVGYLEGIVVDAQFRNHGIARVLCAECEQWAKDKGCKEFASDCEITNKDSFRFHLNIGFDEENRIICFKKEIGNSDFGG